MKLNITMLKKRSREISMNMKRKIAGKSLSHFKTCDLVFELERRTDVCKSMFIGHDSYYSIDYNPSVPTAGVIDGEGPVVIMIIED